MSSVGACFPPSSVMSELKQWLTREGKSFLLFLWSQDQQTTLFVRLHRHFGFNLCFHLASILECSPAHITQVMETLAPWSTGYFNLLVEIASVPWPCDKGQGDVFISTMFLFFPSMLPHTVLLAGKPCVVTDRKSGFKPRYNINFSPHGWRKGHSIET